MGVKLLNEHHLESLNLKEGCIGLSESPLAKMPHCWKSHVAAHITFVILSRGCAEREVYSQVLICQH